MSDERALLAAICAQPEEDTPRLAYADWLDENAGAMPAKKRESVRLRAELIRVQCELARLPPEEEDVETATRRAELEIRQGELLADEARRKEWARPVNPPPAGYEEFVPKSQRFVRGFPEFVDNAFAERNGFLTVSDAIFDISPVHHIDCRNIHGEWADRFLALPWLPRVRRLSISTDRDRSHRAHDGEWRDASDGTDAVTTEKLFAARTLANLESLTLRKWEFRSPGALRLPGVLTKLHDLKLSGGNINGPEAFVRLGELLPSQLRLRDFGLNDSRYGTEELRAFGAVAQLERLERLSLGMRMGAIEWQPDPLGIEGVHAITSAPFWPHLRAFRDTSATTNIGAAEIMELIAAPPSPNLRTLGLGTGNLHMGFVPLLCSPLLGSVTTLDLSNAGYGDFLASYLRWCLHLSRLLVLRLDRCEIATKGIRELAQASFAPNLVRLSLAGSSLRKQAVDVLVAPGSFPRLRLLDVRWSVPNSDQQERLRKRFGNGVIL